MNKKLILYLFTAVLLGALIIGYFSIKNNEKSKLTSSLDAVPLDANFIIELNEPTKNLQELKNSQILQILLKTDQLKSFKKQFMFLDSILLNNKTISNVTNKGILISAHNSPTGIDFLLSVKISNNSKKRKLKEEIKNYIDSSKTIVYNNVELYTYSSDDNEWYFSFCENIFVLSRSLEKVKQAIRQILSKNPINLNLGFKQVNTLASNKMKIFINYKNYPTLLKFFVASKYKSKINNLTNFAKWTALNINVTQNLVSFSGYTSISKDNDNYLSVFSNIKPGTFEEDEVIPYKASEFLSINIRDFAKFYSNYQKYLSTKNLTPKYEKLSQDFYKNYRIKIQPELIPLLNGNLTFVNCIFNTSTKKVSKFLLIKSKNESDFQNFLEKIKVNTTTNPKNEEIDDKKSISIYQIKTSDFLRILMDQLTNFPNFNYYIIYDGYFIFGQSIEDLKLYYLQLYREKTLNNNTDYKEFRKNLSDKSNIFYYTNNLYNYHSELNLFKDEYKKYFKQNLSFFKKMQFITLQFSYIKNDIFQTFVNIKYNNNPVYNGLTNWEIKLSNKLKNKPMIFINHYTFEKELLVIDTSNIVYLINVEGQIEWNKKVTDKIVGAPYMVDLYNNGKYQIIFATTNYIITLDRNGEIVKEKTITLPDKTEKGIYVFDYDKNRNYRIFVPSGKHLYLLDKNLKKVEGWKFKTTKTDIISDVYHFSYEGKDYIVFATKSKIYILKRNGETRVSVKETISFGQNPSIYFQPKTDKNEASFVTSDATGNVLYIDLKGNITKKKVASVSANHNFIAADLNNDKNLDYIFSDENFILVYDNNGDPIFAHTFKGNVSKPLIMKFSEKEVKISVTDIDNNLVYLFNSDGENFKNFPVTGDSFVTISNLQSSNFNLITGFNNYLYNYILY